MLFIYEGKAMEQPPGLPFFFFQPFFFLIQANATKLLSYRC